MRGENIDLQAGGLLGWSKISTQLLAVLLIEREGGELHPKFGFSPVLGLS